MTPFEVALAHHWREVADHVFLLGSTPWEVDEALVAYGFSAGPYQSEDELGLDQTGAIERSGPLPGRMMALGKLGRKTGAGWYRYPGGGGAVEDPIVADLALEEAHFAGLVRTDFSMVEIQERVLLALVSKATALVQSGAIKSAEDADAATVRACGFPIAKGGPLSQADALGLNWVHARLADLHSEAPSLWFVDASG